MRPRSTPPRPPPRTLFAVYVGKCRATATAMGTASEVEVRAVMTPRVCPCAGGWHPARRALTANAAAGQLCRDTAVGNTPIKTSLRRPPLSHGTMMERLPPLSPACTAATASCHTVRRDSGREATNPGDRSAPRLPRMTTLSAASAAETSAAKSTGETASHSSFVSGISTAGTGGASAEARGTMVDATRRFAPVGATRRATIARDAAPMTAARGADTNAGHDDVAIATLARILRTRPRSIATESGAGSGAPLAPTLLHRVFRRQLSPAESTCPRLHSWTVCRTKSYLYCRTSL